MSWFGNITNRFMMTSFLRDSSRKGNRSTANWKFILRLAKVENRSLMASNTFLKNWQSVRTIAISLLLILTRALKGAFLKETTHSVPMASKISN